MIRRRVLTIGAAVLMLVAGLVIVVAALSGVGSREKGRTIPGPRAGDDLVGVRPTSVPQATATPQPEPTPIPSSAPIERLLIPRIKVDAGVQVLGLTKDGAMQDPNGPVQVGWYDLSSVFPDFSSYPGWGGNAVFAGHVDYHDYGAAVFWYLRDLQPDDEIVVRLTDGTKYTYRVVTLDTVSEDARGRLITSGGTEVTVNDIVGPTDKEVVTIITCSGDFDPKTREYNRRLIVRAVRQLEQTSARAE